MTGWMFEVMSKDGVSSDTKVTVKASTKHTRRIFVLHKLQGMNFRMECIN
jgi:hypothetical protein